MAPDLEDVDGIIPVKAPAFMVRLQFLKGELEFKMLETVTNGPKEFLSLDAVKGKSFEHTKFEVVLVHTLASVNNS